MTRALLHEASRTPSLRRVCSVDLTPGQGRALRANLQALVQRGRATDADRVRALDPIAAIVGSARARLAAAAPPVIRVRGLPVDGVDRSAAPHATPLADAFLHAWSCALGGQPMVYAEARGGALFQDVFPRPDALDKPHAHGAASIRWHIDGGGYPKDLVPNQMGLLGLGLDARAPTLLAAFDEVLAALPPRLTRALEEPLYRYRLPDGRGGVHRDRFTPWLPLVTRPRPRSIVGYMFPYVLPRPHTDAEEAITALERVADAIALRLVVEEGDLVFWANGPFMHRRGAIPGAGAGAFRWLKRVFSLRVTHHNADALGADHVLRAEPAVLERLASRYR